MDIAWGSNHMKTLSELTALAEKHNCTIELYTQNYDENISDVPDTFKLDNKSKKIIENHSSEGRYNFSSICLELHDISKGTYCRLNYIEEILCGFIEDSDELDEDTKEELDLNSDNYFYLREEYDEIEGFKGVEEHGCYREGMVVKYFGDMVCDYLKEPRIIRTY